MLALLLVGVGAGPASAHAELVASDPAAGSVLPQAPTRVELRFDELVESGQGQLDVFAPDGRRLDGIEVVGRPSDGHTLQARLPTGLAPGTYAVRFHVLSVDGHPVGGALRFAIGAPTLALDAEISSSGGVPSLLGGTGRALADIGLLALVGLTAFRWLVIRPATRHLPAEHLTATRRRVLQRLWPWQLAATGLAGFGGLLLLLDSAAQSRGFAALSVGGHLGDVWHLVTATRPGHLLGARLLGLLAVAGLLLHARPARRETAGAVPDAALAVLPLALLATVSLASHAAVASTGAALGVALDWTHLLAAGVWTGGLLGLALAAMPTARDLVPRDQLAAAGTAAAFTGAFARTAQLAMLTVLLTGAYPALRNIHGPAQLHAPWGVELVIKLALWATVLLVAALTTVWTVPRMSSRAASVSARLTACGDLASAVRIELALAAALVTVAAVLAGTALPDRLV